MVLVQRTTDHIQNSLISADLNHPSVMDFIVRKANSSSSSPAHLMCSKPLFSSLPRRRNGTTKRAERRRSRSCPNLSRIDGWNVRQAVGDNEPDSTFVVQNLKFIVHSKILAASSDVFRVMLQEPQWATEEVQIKDVKCSSFWLLLIALYYGWEHVRTSLELEDAVELFFLAHKYNVRSLLLDITKFLQRNLTPDRVMEVLDFAELYGLNSLKSCCWGLIERNTKAVVSTPAFRHISFGRLVDILGNSRLTIHEYDLFEGVMRWCRTQMNREENRGKSAMEILGQAVYRIRFPLMTPGEFDLVLKSGILAWGEVMDLNSNFRRNTNFCHAPRRNYCYCRRHRIWCRLCTAPKPNSSVPSVDGRDFKSSELKFRHAVGYLGVNGPPERCECIKYFSCPSFPGSKTTFLMEAQRMV